MLLGKSGSGKTSLLNIIGSIDRPTRGDVRVCGLQFRSSTTDSEFALLRRRKLGFVFQTFNLINSLSAVENVALPLILSGVSRAQATARARMLLGLVGLQERCNHEPSQLSGGEQQRVTIARALANSPQLLLLDEPTGDLDSVNTDNIMAILFALNRIMGVTMVMVTHDPHLKSYANKALHMLDGKLLREEMISSVTRSELATSKGLGELLERGVSRENDSEEEKRERLMKFLGPRQRQLQGSIARGGDMESPSPPSAAKAVAFNAAGAAADNDNKKEERRGGGGHMILRDPEHYAELGLSFVG